MDKVTIANTTVMFDETEAKVLGISWFIHDLFGARQGLWILLMRGASRDLIWGLDELGLFGGLNTQAIIDEWDS